MDAIGLTAFGIDIDSQNAPNDPFVANLEPILSVGFLTKLMVLTTGECKLNGCSFSMNMILCYGFCKSLNITLVI